MRWSLIRARLHGPLCPANHGSQFRHVLPTPFHANTLNRQVCISSIARRHVLSDTLLVICTLAELPVSPVVYCLEPSKSVKLMASLFPEAEPRHLVEDEY